MAKRIVSLKDISKACGVSIATVSKALNDHSDISKETKERIKEVADKLGYHPNAAAQALKTNRSNNIGVLFVDEANSGLTHDYFSHVLDSFKKKAEQEAAEKIRDFVSSWNIREMYLCVDPSICRETESDSMDNHLLLAL